MKSVPLKSLEKTIKNIVFEVCPSSNIILLGNSTETTLTTEDLKKSCPIYDMYKEGYKICLGTDDPAIFTGQPLNSKLTMVDRDSFKEIDAVAYGTIKAEELIVKHYLWNEEKKENEKFENFIKECRKNETAGSFASPSSE